MSLENEKKPIANAKADKESEADFSKVELDDKELDMVAGGKNLNCIDESEGCIGVW